MLKIFTPFVLLLLCGTQLKAQVGVSVIGWGSMNVYTPGKANTPKCQSPATCTGGLPVYIFNGKGNWDDANNWQDFLIPPAVLPAGFEIVINPSGNDECILNIPLQRITPGAKLTVATGKKFQVLGVLNTE